MAAADLSSAGDRRPPSGALIELHAHSSEVSLDSGATGESLVAQARARGLDGICLTEHNALWSASALRDLGERCEFPVFAGMELGTNVGHVLAFGLEQFHPELLMMERLQLIAEREGAALVLAHPMRPFPGRRPPWTELPQWFHGVEVINGDHADSEDGYLVRQVTEIGLAAIGGSDAHTREAVGRVATAFPRSVRAVDDIVRAIRLAETLPVDFRPRALVGAK